MRRIFKIIVCLFMLLCVVLYCGATSPEIKKPVKGDHPRRIFNHEDNRLFNVDE